MAYLELGKTGPKQRRITISASIFTENSVCQLQKTFKFTQDGEEWKEHTGTPFLLKEIKRNTIELVVREKTLFG